MSKTKQPTPSLYQTVLSLLKDKKGLSSTEVATLDAATRRIGWVESKNNPSALQDGGGPGRGMFQFEVKDKGGSNEAKTVETRLSNFEKTYGKLPLSAEVRKELAKPQPDFTKLPEDAQKALLWVNLTMKTDHDEVGDVAKGKLDVRDLWLQYHWAGKGEEERAKKEAQWEREMRDYQRIVGRANP